MFSPTPVEHGMAMANDNSILEDSNRKLIKYVAVFCLDIEFFIHDWSPEWFIHMMPPQRFPSAPEVCPLSTLLLTPLTNTLAIDRKSFSCLVEAGFIIAVPFYHGHFKLNSVGVATKTRHICDDRKRLKMDQLSCTFSTCPISPRALFTPTVPNLIVSLKLILSPPK